MRRMLVFSLLGLPLAALAGSLPLNRQDCDLIPGDFGKSVVITLIPGAVADPWVMETPIIIDEDGPSDDEQGMIYATPRRLNLQPRRTAPRAGLDH